jgi:hypothetical protein
MSWSTWPTFGPARGAGAAGVVLGALVLRRKGTRALGTLEGAGVVMIPNADTSSLQVPQENEAC